MAEGNNAYPKRIDKKKSPLIKTKYKIDNPKHRYINTFRYFSQYFKSSLEVPIKRPKVPIETRLIIVKAPLMNLKSQKEDEIKTLNKMNSTLNKNIRKKIISSIKKEKIINLWKFQNEIMNSKYDNDKTYQISSFDECDQNLIL